MKQTVTVNGVTLTRAQVEQAYKEINTPEPWLKHFDLVRSKSDPTLKGIVIVGEAQRTYRRGIGSFGSNNKFTIIDTNGTGHTNTSDNLLCEWVVISNLKEDK